VSKTNTMRDPGEEVLLLLGRLAMAPIAVFFRAAAFQWMWSELAVPRGAEPVDLLTAWALAIMASFWRRTRPQPAKDSAVELGEAAFDAVARPAFACLFVWALLWAGA